MGAIGRRWGLPLLLAFLLVAASVVGGQKEGGSGSSEEEKKMKRHTKDNPKCTCTHDRDYIGHYVGNISCPVRPQERIPVAFVFWYTPDHPGAEPYWHDPGFRGAMKGLETNHSMDVVWYNLNDEGIEQQLLDAVGGGMYAYVFSKGCWHTPADKFMRGKLIRSKPASVKTGLFPACSSPPPPDEVTGVTIDRAYDTIFYDKMWLEKTFEGHPNAVFAFGIDAPNTFNKTGAVAWHQHPKLWDWVSVGMFAPWKRHERLIDQKGDRLVIGYGWRSDESSSVVSSLFSGGVAVWQQVEPAKMCSVYRSTRHVMMAATELGGGERVILEARACGVPHWNILIADDNEKIKEFLTSRIYDVQHYSSQINRGIKLALGMEPEPCEGEGCPIDYQHPYYINYKRY